MKYHSCPQLAIRLCGLSGHCSVHSHSTEDGELLSSESKSSHDEGDGTGEDDNAEEDKGRIETSSDGQVVSDGKEGRSTFIPQTPSPALARSLVDMRTQTQSQTPERKSSPSGKSSTQKALLRTDLRRSSVKHRLLRRSHQWMRHSAMRPGKKHGCWTHVLMLGIMTRLPKASQAGQQEILWSATSPSMERCSPTTPIPWGHPYATWESVRSLMAFGLISMICADSTLLG